MTKRSWKRAKQLGFSDAQLAYLWDRSEDDVRAARVAAGVLPTYKTVDTCAAEFAAETPYHYSTYEDESEVRPSDGKKVVILGSGPNRIGQGIEFDYCCVHASFALRDAGFETIMVNCNPETVSTDYDTSDRLYFEPLTKEDVLNVIEAEQPDRVIVSLGGQTPLKLSGEIPLELVAGTSPDSIDAAEDRERWNQICDELHIPQPPGGTAVDLDQALAIADEIGFPVLVRPSYVLGGRAMQIVHDGEQLPAAMEELAGFGSLGKEGGLSAERPVLVDRFLADATEVDVDAIRDATGEVLIGGVMEHVEEAGVHSGDSACAIPPQTLPSWVVEVFESYAAAIAKRLDVRGPDQRPVRRGRHDGLRDRGQPAGQSNGAVRRQGDRCAARQGRDSGDARRHARRTPRRGAARAARRRWAPRCRRRRRGRDTPRGRQGSGAAVHPVPRGRSGARARRCARPAR